MGYRTNQKKTPSIENHASTSNGQELLDNTFKHLNLIETAYFGLRFIDNTGQTNWLDPGKKIIKQLEDTEPYTFYFGVKFYAADPCKLLEEITRYQFYLQIKSDVLQGRLPVPFDLAAELCAYAVQSELGDYDPRRHCTGYISEFRFVSNQSPDLEASITELHKSFGGQVPAVAEINYLEKVKWLEMYGVDLHIVMGGDQHDHLDWIGLTPSGIIVLRNKTKVGNYFWPRISKLNNKGKYFMIRVRNKSNEEQTYGFETPSARAACKHLWKCAVEHHAFFRLVQVAPTSLNSGNKINSLNSRFRDSGRSESSVRRRAQPQFVRTPSRRYTRRAVEGSHDVAGSENREDAVVDVQHSNGINKTISVPQPVSTTSPLYRTNSMAQMTRADSPRSVRSAPWPAPHTTTTKSAYSVPSPRSVRSAGVGGNMHGDRERERQREYSKDRKRSASAESNSSVDSRSHRRHRHSRSRKNSDNESEISRSSHHSKRRHKSSSRKENSGSESENCHRHKHRHRHRHSSGKYELVNSEVQWKEAQKKQAAVGAAVQQAAVVCAAKTTATSSVATTRKSGYANSGLETESEMSYSNKRRHRRHRSKSPKERLPDELKKHIDFHLIDPVGMPEDIPYVKVETNNSALKTSKIRYNSIKSNRSHTLRQNTADFNGRQQLTPASPKTYSNQGFVVPPPPSKVVAQNMTKASINKGFDDLNSAKLGTAGRQRNPIMLFNCDEANDIHHPSPSESPDSQKVDSQNSDSGLGTDHHEYYKSETFSSLGYTLPRRGSKDQTDSQNNVGNTSHPSQPARYWNGHEMQQNWLLGPPTNFTHMTNHHALPDRRTMTLDRRPRKPVDPKIHQFIPIEKFKQVIQIPPMPIPVETPSNSSAVTRNGGGRGDFCTVNVPPSSSGRHVSSSGEAATQQRGTTHSRSSSLEMILTPLVTSTRTRL
ncbi:hypothetical protein Fcan01_02506 [Folsomia candida]|uniref:FERM domain-containing protein n=1 Tax=Folsomia candida TaxID=158441 RepID=A0A226F074_FOLCA|nr:hypothetical protein Fcan01_02506 [Folsomia candida]